MIFPQSLAYLPTKKLGPKENTSRNIVVIIAAYNEQENIEDTIHSIFASSVSSKIENLIIGDDGSIDHTKEIILRLQLIYPKLIIESFHRLGKPNIVNEIVRKYKLNYSNYYILLMDANIKLHIDCIKNLEESISYKNTGIVGASVYSKNELSNVESEYIARENKIKEEESRTTHYVIGVFGACFMMKGELYKFIPKDFITDDLFHTFSAIDQNAKILYSTRARVYETILADVSNEFRRKRRYASGNFQILIHFFKLLFPWNSSIGFVYCYFFHKIIRWISPIVFLVLWSLSFINLYGNNSLLISICGTMLCLFLLCNYILQKRGIPIIGKRLYYFFMMNLAILFGFFNYLKGIKSNVWERSERI